MEKRWLVISSIVSSLFAISLVSAAWTFTGMMDQWVELGVFSFVLPFLLVFALIYGILSTSPILGDNKGVLAIIALAIGLLSLYGGFVPRFFAEISVNLAIALSVLLCAIILMGLWIKENAIKWTIIGVGIIAFVAVVVSSFNNGSLGYTGNLWEQYGPALVTLLIIGGIIAFVVFGHTPSSSSTTTK